MHIRPEIASDVPAIRLVTQSAFSGAEHSSGTESEIIDRLRDAGALAVSLVAIENAEIVGHAAFSPVSIAGRDRGWLGLGPISVRPDRQGQGIGSRLIREGLSLLERRGAGGCVVLGDPGYYSRFSFAACPGLTFEGAPPEYFMALPISGPTPGGAVTYQPAFY